MLQSELNSNSQEEMDEAALRLELEHELRNKRQCTYKSYECTQLCLDNYQYCLKHILNDKSAPYKQCSYIYSGNSKRCSLAAPRSDKKDYGYCSEHALKVTLARNRQNSKHPLPCTAEVLLHSLAHYVKKPRIRNSSSSTQHSDEDRVTPDSEQKSSKFLDPFVDFDANTLYNEKCNHVLDVCSESESDIEPSTFSSVWQDAQADSSDDESIDSEHEDVLKHTNVFTAEEVTLLTRDKLIKLQSLYIEQYRYLQYLLTKKRRKYLHSLKREKETCCNISSQIRDNPKEQRLYKKLKALHNYQKCHGTDAILSKRLRDLRVKLSTDGASKSTFFSKCIFTEGGVKCGERSLPLAKHCQKHILEDQNQVLFRACGKMTADVECPTPIAAIFEDATCPIHMEIPTLRSYGQIRKDSESDADDTLENQMSLHQSTSQIAENIKDEFIAYEPPEIPKMESLPSMLFEETLQSVPKKPTTTNIFGIDFSAPEESLKDEKVVDGHLHTVANQEIVASKEELEEKMDVSDDVKGNDSVEMTEAEDIHTSEVVIDEHVVEDTTIQDVGTEYVQTATDSDMRDTAVDALLKAAQMINDQTNANNYTQKISASQNPSDEAEELLSKDERVEVDHKEVPESLPEEIVEG